MPASTSLPLLKRIPPGLWTALVWFATAVQPIVEYVVRPSRDVYSLSYPRDGLGSFDAKALLVLAAVLVVAGSAQLRPRTTVGYVLVIAATVVSTVAWRQDGIPPAQFLAIDVALCYVAATRPRRNSLVAAAGTLGVLAGYLVVRLITGGVFGTVPEAYLALTVAIAWLIGNSVSQAKTHTWQLHTQAAAQSLTAERLRIAREMHDTVAHSVGVITLQAGAAVLVAETQPARAREAMRAVEKTGRETLTGLQHILGVLRETDQDEQEPAPSRPAAGLADVERLAETTTAAGVRVRVRWKGTRRPLPADIDLTAFRIIQESVTNAVRHSGTDSCHVSIDYRTGELAIEVRDHGIGNDTGIGYGYGLTGMRERVTLLRGDFTAGPHPAAGFLVTALLPTPAEAGSP